MNPEDKKLFRHSDHVTFTGVDKNGKQIRKRLYKDEYFKRRKKGESMEDIFNDYRDKDQI